VKNLFLPPFHTNPGKIVKRDRLATRPFALHIGKQYEVVIYIIGTKILRQHFAFWAQKRKFTLGCTSS